MPLLNTDRFPVKLNIGRASVKPLMKILGCRFSSAKTGWWRFKRKKQDSSLNIGLVHKRYAMPLLRLNPGDQFHFQLIDGDPRLPTRVFMQEGFETARHDA